MWGFFNSLIPYLILYVVSILNTAHVRRKRTGDLLQPWRLSFAAKNDSRSEKIKQALHLRFRQLNPSLLPPTLNIPGDRELFTSVVKQWAFPIQEGFRGGFFEFFTFNPPFPAAKVQKGENGSKCQVLQSAEMPTGSAAQ